MDLQIETRFNRRAVLIVPAIYKDMVNLLARQMDFAGAGESFTQELYPLDGDDVTHYVARLPMTLEQFQIISGFRQLAFPSAIIAEYDVMENPELPQNLLASMNLRLKPVEVIL